MFEDVRGYQENRVIGPSVCTLLDILLVKWYILLVKWLLVKWLLLHSNQHIVSQVVVAPSFPPPDLEVSVCSDFFCFFCSSLHLKHWTFLTVSSRFVKEKLLRVSPFDPSLKTHHNISDPKFTSRR